MTEERAIIMNLTSGVQVVGRIVGSNDHIITLSNPYTMEFYGNQISLKQYNPFSSEEKMVDFYRTGIVSTYQTSEKVDAFYELYVKMKTDPTVTADYPEEESEKSSALVVANTPTESREMLGLNFKRVNIDDIRSSVVRLKETEETDDKESNRK